MSLIPYFTNISSTLLAKIPSTDKDFHYYLESFTPSDTIKIVPLEKGVVIYGANALSLLPVVLFVLPINVHV